ncbi:hypothetical protein ACFC50_12510 [Paenibacillus taichungensis]|uniref:hypothetical protein n=1 Tax=Paenibacillus taichungensis TaxID=484184 RepID=UPI0035DECA13
MVHPNGKVEAKLDTLSGQPTRIQERSATKNRETLFTYNSLDQNTKTNVNTDGGQQTTHYSYEPSGKLVAMKDAEGTNYAYTYDENGSLL